MNYQEFLESKKKVHVHSGFDVGEDELPDGLFPFQKFVVKTALSAGKYAVFSGTGTGKTRLQLVWAANVAKRTAQPVLILAPLTVSAQTIQEGTRIGIECKKLTSTPFNGIYIINYDQLDNIEEWIPLFGGVALDEGSILKNEEGSTRNKLIDLFRSTQYKTVFTATPSPNNCMEIGNYSEFLDVMPRMEMLAMYFVHDGGETSQWRLKGHSVKRFYEWMSTWAIMFQKPPDIGFQQSGYDLPPLNIVERKIVTSKRNNGQLFNHTAVSATNFNQELRVTKVERLDQVAEIVNNSDERFLIWIKQNEEGEYLRKLIPEAIEVKGNDTTEWKEEKLLGFANGEFRVLLTKGKIAGMGLNFQICHNQIFASPDFSFELCFQSIRRSWRFGQKDEVTVYIMTTDTMENVIQSFKNKQIQFDEMQAQMTLAVNNKIKKKSKMAREFEETKTDKFHLMLGDCVECIKNIPDNSVGFSAFSPPFSDLYVYSDQLEDMGNSMNYNEFLTAFGFLVKELNRILMPGRLVAVHCMDLPIQKGKEGFIGLRKFSHMIWDAFIDEGFIGHTEIVCWKSPVTEMQRTKALGLLHKQIKKDATMSRVGIPDKILVFRKDGINPVPVPHQDIDSEAPAYLPVDLWQKIASPVWMDVDFGNTLNGREGRDDKDEKHIAPLSLDIIERCYTLWSNEGDTILTPFAGIGSELYQAIAMNRYPIGIELKKSYFDIAVKNCSAAAAKKNQILLFT